MLEAPITQAEMIELFGETMPIEAVKLAWEPPGEMTIGELRAKLRQVAKKQKEPPMSDIVERLRRFAKIEDDMFSANGFESAKSPCADAADEIERLRKCLRIAKRDMMATDLNRQHLKRTND